MTIGSSTSFVFGPVTGTDCGSPSRNSATWLEHLREWCGVARFDSTHMLSFDRRGALLPSKELGNLFHLGNIAYPDNRRSLIYS